MERERAEQHIFGRGKLLIKILNAELTRDANNVFLMNPMCIFDILGLPD